MLPFHCFYFPVALTEKRLYDTSSHWLFKVYPELEMAKAGLRATANFKGHGDHPLYPAFACKNEHGAIANSIKDSHADKVNNRDRGRQAMRYFDYRNFFCLFSTDRKSFLV